MDNRTPLNKRKLWSRVTCLLFPATWMPGPKNSWCICPLLGKWLRIVPLSLAVTYFWGPEIISREQMSQFCCPTNSQPQVLQTGRSRFLLLNWRLSLLVDEILSNFVTQFPNPSVGISCHNERYSFIYKFRNCSYFILASFTPMEQVAGSIPNEVIKVFQLTSVCLLSL
jgi:hypothetical protein